ncbi:mandelate racemase/muconate lactonizing enzyme family protein [Amaricoccus tamworthensis]|uniref:mandelate racemase/muconate lactonizing enzyme family protein n=1 Tax=Amaricoccus tamworthensis TaxID=57002 RepID=UPI003C7B70E5
MKIIRIETFSNPFVGFTRVTDETGATGWGQMSTYHSDITAQVLHRQVAPWTIGIDIDDLDDHLNLIQEREHKFPGSYICRAMGGLETAIWDLRGKQAGVPVATLLGGSPGKIRAYASSMKRDITPANEADRFRRLRGDYGFDAFKFRIGAEVGRGRDEWESRTGEIIPTIAKTFAGEDVTLLVDANSCYAPDQAITWGHMLLDHGITHYEEPCPYWELDQTRTVREAFADTPLDVTGGEQDCMIPTWKRMIDMHAVDIVQPDVMYVGGMGRTLEVARLAEAAGLPVTPHCANLSLVTLFTMHLLRAIPNAGKYLEFSIEGEDYYPWQQDLFVTDPYAITDGMAEVTDAPGWGIEVNPEWLAKSIYQVSEMDD